MRRYEQTNINVHLLTIEAAMTRRKNISPCRADPTRAPSDIDDIYAMVDELIEAHGDWLPKFDYRKSGFGPPWHVFLVSLGLVLYLRARTFLLRC